MKKRFIAGALLGAIAAGLAVSRPSVSFAGKAKKITVADHIKTFDELDFDVFTNQKWDRLKESHSSDITVVWPDGHETHGIQKHIEDLKFMFTYAPDTAIRIHPVKFGFGDYTAVIGEMTGTFTQPMAGADGKSIPPTGKSFKLGMATIGHWKGATMDKEWLFWDNQSYVNQIGL
jgi:hypothetical protein